MTQSADERHPFGAGSHAPLADEREMPACYPIKGNADSMLYHRPDSRNYGATIAEVWFVSPSAAEAAGFTLSSTHPKDSSSADFEPGAQGHPCTAAEVQSTVYGGSAAHPFGPGSHAPLADEREMPACYPIKGNADSMLYHRPDSRNYGATIAEVWFVSPSAAEAAGFTLSSTHPKDSSSADFEPGAQGHPCTAAEVQSTVYGGSATSPTPDPATPNSGDGDEGDGDEDGIGGAGIAAAAAAGAGALGLGAAIGDSGDDAAAASVTETVVMPLAGAVDAADDAAASGAGSLADAADTADTAETAATPPASADAGSGAGDAGDSGAGDGGAGDGGAGSGWDGMSDDERHPFGPGSHAPDPDDVHRMPICHPIKGNADSMKYHRPDSHSYAVTTAEVWFVSPSAAEAAGFALAGAHPKGSSSADFEPGADGHPCSASDVEGLGLGGLLLGAGAGAAGIAAVAGLGGDAGAAADVGDGVDADAAMATADDIGADATVEMAAVDDIGADATVEMAVDDIGADATVEMAAASDASAAWDGMSDADLHPFGPGSHAPNPVDVHLMPVCHPIKGNADSMKYHRPDSQGYEPTKAEVWFVSPSVAEAAGFALAGSHPEGSSSADFEPGGSGHPCAAADVEGMGLGGLLLGGAALAGIGAVGASLLGGDGDDADLDVTTDGDLDAFVAAAPDAAAAAPDLPEADLPEARSRSGRSRAGRSRAGRSRAGRGR